MIDTIERIKKKLVIPLETPPLDLTYEDISYILDNTLLTIEQRFKLINQLRESIK